MLLSRGNKMFNKVMTNKRKNHIINILEGFDHDHLEYGSNIPLDLHLRKYYLNNNIFYCFNSITIKMNKLYN